HPQRLVLDLGEVTNGGAAVGAVGVDVHLVDVRARGLAVGEPVGGERAGVGLVHGGDHGVGGGAGLGELGREGVDDQRLARGADVGTLLAAACRVAVGAQLRAPVRGVGLVERVDRVNRDAVGSLEAFDGAHHVG